MKIYFTPQELLKIVKEKNVRKALIVGAREKLHKTIEKSEQGLKELTAKV